MSQNTRTLLTIAAEMRAVGHSWESVGRTLQRKAGTCQAWTKRFRDEWNQIYREVQTRRFHETSDQAHTLIQGMMRSHDVNLRFRAVQLWIKNGAAAYGYHGSMCLPDAQPVVNIATIVRPPPPRICNEAQVIREQPKEDVCERPDEIGVSRRDEFRNSSYRRHAPYLLAPSVGAFFMIVGLLVRDRPVPSRVERPVVVANAAPVPHQFRQPHSGQYPEHRDGAPVSERFLVPSWRAMTRSASLAAVERGANRCRATAPTACRDGGAPGSRSVLNPDDDDPATTRSAGGSSPRVADPPVPASTGRYLFVEEIASGGMGVVYRATDTHLARDVAVKILLAGYGPNSAAARRFEDEARITAQLQHPFIPAVHDFGTLADGRPFLAMKLIKGQTLDACIAHRTDPSADRGHLVAVFEQICQGVGYAHAHGVIHRDLKPSNVMVGSFGEVQVMDWGLAKVLSATRPPPADSAIAETRAETAIHSLRDSDGSETQAGSVLGTPAFMPPEQAIGAVDQIDERSDVFGLGGILAAILTGRPPYQGDTSESTRQMAAMGRVQDCFARLDASGADPELVALAKRCLAVEKGSRPANAGEVARAVADLREAADERARRAELDRATTAARMVERRKRRRLAAAATTVLVIGLASIAVIQWRNARRQAEEEARTRSAKVLAEDRLRQATDIWYTQVIDVQNELDDQNISPVLRRKLLRAAREKIIDLLKDQPRSREVDHMMHVLHRRLSNASLALGELAEAEREWQECHAIAEARLRDDPDAPEARRDLASAHVTLGDIRDRANDLPAALAEYDRAVAMFEAHAAARPDDRRTTEDLLNMATRRGDALLRTGQAAEALTVFEAGLARARKASTADPDNVTLARTLMSLAQRLGDQAVRLEMFGEAEARYNEAIAVLDRLQKADPNNPQFLRDRAAGLRDLGDLEFGRERISAARRYFLQALQLRQRLAERSGASPQAFVDLGLAFERLGLTSSFVRDYDRAAAEFGEEVANIRRALYREDDPARQDMLARALNEFGNALQGARRWGEARRAFTDGLAMRRQLRVQGRDAVGLVVNEAESHSYLTFLEREPPFHDFAAALEHARAGVALLDPLEKAGRLEGQAVWKRTADTLRQNVDYLEWAVRTLDPLEQVLTRGSTDKALLLRARVLASRGKTAEVVEAAEALGRLRMQPAGHLSAARVYMLALSSAPHPTDEPFASQAVEAIRKAVAAGADRQVIASDPDFASLRPRDDFKKVVASDS